MSGRAFSRCLGAAAAVAGLVALGGEIRQAVTPDMEAPMALSLGEQERLDHAPSASLLGELRGGFADYLWLKADHLVHNGVEMRALTVAEERDQHRWHASEASGQSTPVARHEEGETTVVPNPEADHRGILGNLEREIKPYMDMRHHRHRDPGETAALFRLMTWANPRLVPAWIVGANVLAENLAMPKAAVAFLQEGAAKNPDSLEIQAEIGRYLLYNFHDAPAAERCFRRAIALGERQPALLEEEADAWENAHRWLFIQYHSLGRSPEARAVARLAIRRFPQSGYFRHALLREEKRGDRPS